MILIALFMATLAAIITAWLYSQRGTRESPVPLWFVAVATVALLAAATLNGSP